MKLVYYAAFMCSTALHEMFAVNVVAVEIAQNKNCAAQVQSNMQDYKDDELAQIGADADATFIMAMGGMNKPKPCSAAGNLNSPIINVINRRTRVVHSHRFPKKEPSKD